MGFHAARGHIHVMLPLKAGSIIGILTADIDLTLARLLAPRTTTALAHQSRLVCVPLLPEVPHRRLRVVFICKDHIQQQPADPGESGCGQQPVSRLQSSGRVDEWIHTCREQKSKRERYQGIAQRAI